ncbi:EF-hand calcium-binding domain-containing protein 1-like [Dendronephthya gigantea]|uniref:EF-hand calcium-binding domain-containing protein 1-like n=1 Tax=Dendronephthya gigantea TaxID=151771 RepID=UPI001069F732|nr:EF-hand calcium-binding domain-containing protein 1-like [Dendronephthya gigantea]
MVLKSLSLLMLFVVVAQSCSRRRGGGGGGGGGRPTCTPICTIRCYPMRICSPGRGCRVERNCGRVCTYPCRSVKKRAVQTGESDVTILLPDFHKFSDYDSDQNGEISKSEFSSVLNVTEKDAQEAFEFLDINKDGKITPDEFEIIKRSVNEDGAQLNKDD